MVHYSVPRLVTRDISRFNFAPCLYCSRLLTLLPRPLESNCSPYGIEIKFKNSSNGKKFTITTFLDLNRLSPRIITIEVASLQESPSFSPYNDNQSTLILVSMFKINKDENLFLGRVERKESVVEKESVP